MIRIILDKVDNEYVVDAMNTRTGAQLDVSRHRRLEDVYIRIDDLIDEWHKMENIK